jgi:hypothetical protein
MRGLIAAATQRASRGAARIGEAADARVRAVTSRPAAAVDTTGTSSVVVPAEQSAATGSGLLVMFSRVPMDLFESGRRIGSTDVGDIVLPAGRHRIQAVSRPLNYQLDVVVDVRAGAVTSRTIALPEGLLEVSAEPGAEVWIDGERIGAAPVPPQAVPLGSRQVVARYSDGSERRAFPTVRYGETARVVIDRGGLAADPRFPLPRGSEFKSRVP